jgi:hypothetical protein
MWCQAIGSEYDVAPATVAGVVAALSPRHRWDDNLKAAERYIVAHKAGEPMPTCNTFPPNREKAYLLLDGRPLAEVLQSQKVSAFVANILGDTDQVCVDTWAMRAACDIDETTVRLTGLRYRQIADAYRAVAPEFNLNPRDAQAVSWGLVRASF